MEFTYNDELLLQAHDRENAQKSFPDIFFVLDHEALRREFTAKNTLANNLKAKSRRCGFAAVVLATVALLIAAFEQVIHASLGHDAAWAPKCIAGVAAGVGVISVALG